MYQSTNGPKSWPATAALFASAILDDDPLPLYKHVSGTLFVSSSQSELSRVAVGCADSPPTTKGSGVGAEEAAKEMMRVLGEVSPHFGGSVSLIEQDGNCEFWTQREDGPKGFRFTGPWNVRPSSPSCLSDVPSDLLFAHPFLPVYSGDTDAHHLQHRFAISSTCAVSLIACLLSFLPFFLQPTP